MIIYKDNIDNIDSDMLKGFFAGWKTLPSAEKHLELLQNSDYKIIAIDEDEDENENKAVGFITAISDRVLSAYIPLLEVLPEYQNKGIGSELVKRMLDKLKDFYMIDIVCDESLQAFYEKFGMKKYSAMIKRNYDRQSGTERM